MTTPIVTTDNLGSLNIDETRPLINANSYDPLVTFSIQRTDTNTYQLIYKINADLSLNLNYQIQQVPNNVPIITSLDPNGRASLSDGDYITFISSGEISTNEFTSNIMASISDSSQFGTTYFRQRFSQEVTLFNQTTT